MAGLKSRWEQYWFAPKDALTLGVCRLLFFGLLFWNYAGQQFAPWGDVPRGFWDPDLKNQQPACRNLPGFSTGYGRFQQSSEAECGQIIL